MVLEFRNGRLCPEENEEEMVTCENRGMEDQISDEFPLSSLYINPTRYCNLCCKHCWVSPPYKEELGSGDEELSTGEIVDIVKAAKNLGLSCVKLTGGEPLLRKGLGSFLEFCAGSDIEVWIETNGVLVTKDVAKMLKKFKVSLISISIDSASEEKHDFFRGRKGAFRRTIEGIENLKDENISPQVIISLYKENLKDFDKFIQLMHTLSVNNIKINTISPIGRGSELQDTELVPTIKEILDFSEKLRVKYESFKGYLFLDIPMAFKSLDEIKNRGGYRTCAIRNILGILSDGSVSICGIGYMDEDLLFGNVRGKTSSLGDIWHNNPVLKRIREDIPSKLEGVCGICVFKNKCLGSCRAEVYYNTGSLVAPYWFCQEAYDEGLFPSTRVMPEALRT
jgi:SynChlorMet cassette radical SAM/SPASM protein ScmF